MCDVILVLMDIRKSFTVKSCSDFSTAWFIARRRCGYFNGARSSSIITPANNSYSSPLFPSSLLSLIEKYTYRCCVGALTQRTQDTQRVAVEEGERKLF